MSDQDQWSITTDRSYYAGGCLSGIEYHQKLNLLFISSEQSGVLVYDSTSSTLLKKTDAAAKQKGKIFCRYVGSKDGLLISDGNSVTVRKDLNGMYLLDTALRTKIDEFCVDDTIKLEIALSDAETLVNGVTSCEMLKVDKMDELIENLKHSIEAAQSQCQDNQKKTKWCTVTLEYPQSVLLYVFQHIMIQLKTKAEVSLALPIAAAITERCGYYATDFSIDNPVPLDRALMYSEAARLATFENWPHMGYQWAKPEAMSRAGFYHDPTSTNDDRSMCFTCNVCLVCWEKTDEPWSEHERHQPGCPFIKGLPTQNVPLAVYYASQPAIKSKHKSLSISKCGADNTYLAALEEDETTIKIWRMGRQLELCFDLTVAPQPFSEISDSMPMLESSAMGDGDLSKFKVTALCLLASDRGDEHHGMRLVAASLCHQKIEIICYETGRSSTPIDKMDLDPSIAAAFSSPEQLAEAIYLEQQYLVTEPPKDKSQRGVVVRREGRLANILEIPDAFCYPGYYVQWVEQSLDRLALLVYISFVDLNNCPVGIPAGALLLYKIKMRGGVAFIHHEHSKIKIMDSVKDAIVHINQLSLEFSSTRETDGGDCDQDDDHMMITKRSGAISLFSVKLLREIATYTSDSHKFLHSVYCSGIDRVCATTTQGEVVMLQVNPVMASINPATGDVVDGSAANRALTAEIDELFKAPLTVRNLKQLSELTECENLSGKFTATLPGCWNEVQQDQHQRKHPLHLQQSALSTASERQATNTTRTWKLQPDSDTSMKDHSIEISLPKICSVGHVDIRFTLQGKAKEIPDVKVALLCYKIETRRNVGKGPAFITQSNDRSFLTKSYLDKHNLQLLSAPVSLTSAGDVSGLSGIITLTAPALLEIKPRSLVIFMKMSEPSSKSDTSQKQERNSRERSSQDRALLQIDSMLFPQVRAPSLHPFASPGVGPRSNSPRNEGGPSNRRTPAAPKSDSGGIDLIDELSISVRKTKTTSVTNEKMTRLAMLEHSELHQTLTEVAYKGHLAPDVESPLIATENNRVAAMRILGWIASVQMNDVTPRRYENTILGVVQENLGNLVEHCLIRGTRSSSHALARLLTVSTELSRRLEGSDNVNRFSESLLTALLENMDKLKESLSSGAVSTFFLLLSRVQCLNTPVVCPKVCDLLLELSKLYSDSFADPEMCRLSSYGLTSCPYDAEVFDAVLPNFVSKNLVSPSQPQNQGMNYPGAPVKSMPKSSEVSPVMIDLTSTACQGLFPSEQLNMRVGGLLEVEPLQYSINSYSEYINVTHGSNSNVTPVFYGSGSTNAPDPASLTEGLPINIPQTAGSYSKMVSMANKMTPQEAHQKLQESYEAMKKIKKSMKSLKSTKLPEYTSYSSTYPTAGGASTSKYTSTTASEALAKLDHLKQKALMATGNVAKKLKTSSPPVVHTSYPGIQAILQPPNEFTLIAGRMTAGNARRFIVLDFGQPIRLTDVVIPACSDVTSLAIDVWLKAELVDSQRLVVCTDIQTKCLVLSDIQPACVCRYLKVTYAPKTSGAGQTYRIPLGVFYGHAYVFPWETSADVVALRTPEEVWRQIGIYTAAVEDIRCCYKLACSRLQHLLQSAENQSVEIDNEEHDLTAQIQQTHDECQKLQKQLNLATSAMRRLRSVLPAACETDANQAPPTPCRDKLRYLIEALLSILINTPDNPIPGNLYKAISATVCKQLFVNLCIHGSRRLQLLTGNLIVQVCSGQAWYGKLFEQILIDMFSSSYSTPFPKLKVFGLLASMAQKSLTTGRKASHRVCTQVLELLASQLTPLHSADTVTGFIDMQLVSWLLLFLSKLTDSNFDTTHSLLMNRWEFLSSETSLSKRKVYHRYSARHKAKQERTQMAMRQRFNPSTSRGGSGGSTKGRDRMMKKQMMRHERMRLLDSDWPDPMFKRRMMMMMGDPEFLMMDRMMNPHPTKLARLRVILDKAVILPVVRGLMSLILNVNFSCHSDMYILACKVLSRLAVSARPTLKISEVITSEQLKKLLYNITHCKYNSRTQSWGGDWGKHAVMCLLEDLVEGERANLDLYDNGVDPEDEDDEDTSPEGASSSDSDALIEMLGDSPSDNPGGSRSGRFPLPEMMGPGGMRSIDLLRMLHRDEMLAEDMMDMEMEMDMMYGGAGPLDMEEMIMEQMASYRHMPPSMMMHPAMFGGPRPRNADAPPTANVIMSPVSCAIDGRLKYACDASAELRLQLWLSHELSNQQNALSARDDRDGSNPHRNMVKSSDFQSSGAEASTMASPASDGAGMDDSAYTQNGNETLQTPELLGHSLSDLIVTERDNIDMESLLLIFLQLTEEFREDSREGFDPALRPHMTLTPEAIETLVNCIASGKSVLSARGWTQLLRVLTILLNSDLTDEDRAFAVRLCGSETFHLLVNRFLRCPKGVGPIAVKAFEDLLNRIQIVHTAANENLDSFTAMLLNTVSKNLAESSTRMTLVDGALDAQCALVEFIQKLPVIPLVRTTNILSLFELTINIAKSHIDNQDTVVELAEPTDPEIDVTLCFQSPPATSDIDDEASCRSVPTENQLVVSLLNLLCGLLKPSLPRSNDQQAETDSSKLSRGSTAAADQLDEGMDTGEAESGQTDEQKRTEGEALPAPKAKYKCLHVMDVDAPATLADSVLSNRPLVATLIQCLAGCKSYLATPKNIKQSITIGDGVFQLLHLLFRTSTNYYQMLELLQEHISSSRVVSLSEPLRLFIRVTLNCEHTISRFIELDGMNCISSRFVESYAACPDLTTGMITSVLQHLTTTYSVRTAPPTSTTLSNLMMTSSTSNEPLMNFAPLGNIYSSNPSVGPMYSLIQINQTHRRARTAPWSHKFPADRPWIDISVLLPCSVLVKEIQIHPYVSSIHTAGPSQVSVELSHDGLPTLPARRPLITNGLTCIKVAFLQAEIVTMVTVRLYKPRDSASIGLTQICIMGYPGLAEPGTVPPATNTSLSWLQLLYHCIDHIGAMSTPVIRAIEDKTQVLNTCCSLLMSNFSSVVMSRLEKVIIELSVRSIDISKKVIDILLRQNHRALILVHSPCMSTDATAEILYKICLHQDEHASVRVSLLTRWLEDCAAAACLPDADRPCTDPGVVRPSRLHIQCVAAILWKSAQLNIFEVSTLFSSELFTHLYKWSLTLKKNLPMKRCVDGVIAAICHIEPPYFHALLQKFFMTGLPNANAATADILRASVTDDAKDDVQQEMLTDERKEVCRFAEDVIMDSSHLSLLATAAQSPSAAQSLIDSTLLRVLSQALTEFCLKELQQSNSSTNETDPTQTNSTNSVVISWKTLPIVLTFFKECASANPQLKDWMGASDGQLFWALLLELFSSTQRKGSFQDQLIETSIVSFFKNVTLNHTVNQLAFSDVMCNLLRVIASMPNGVAGASLSGFMKNLLLQTMLEDEKIYVTITSHGLNYRFSSSSNMNASGAGGRLGVGTGHSTRTVHVSMYETMKELAERVTKPDAKKDSARSKLLKMRKPISHSEMSEEFVFGGIPITPETFIDDIIHAELAESAHALQHKKSTSTQTLQTDQSKMKSATRTVQFQHPRIPDQVLDGSVTVAELVVSLLEKGFPQGSEHIELEIYNGMEKSGNICQLNTETSSTLKVFTGLGGLALLADHLPLLYPEITQQNRPTSASSSQQQSAAVLSDQDFEFVTQVKGISLSGMQYEATTVGPDGKKEASKKLATGTTTIPPHSLVAFGLFLRLPGYAEMLIKQRVNAKCILRLVLGVRDDGDGTPILASAAASTLPTLPFTNLKLLYQSSPLTTDDGLMLRRTSMEAGALHLVLACLSSLSHHSPRKSSSESSGEHDQLTQAATQMANQVIGSNRKPPSGASAASGASNTPLTHSVAKKDEHAGQSYWAKGTGFGTGSTTTQWDLEQLLLKQQGDEDHVTCLLDIISAMINPDDKHGSDSQTSLPAGVYDRLSESCLLPAIAAYLRNDSVLDMSRHVPLYQSVYRVLRALASSEELVSLLRENVSKSDSSTLNAHTANMAKCVATYKNRLRPSTAKRREGEKKTEEDEQENSLNELAVVLADTQNILTQAIERHRAKMAVSPIRNRNAMIADPETVKVPESYESIFKDIQFDTFRFIEEDVANVKFLSHHHFEVSLRQHPGSSNHARTRRLAQEAVTLSTSLPLSASSSVFVRCDEERMDIMKVLITGPSDTPYMNGCFEFDIFFPPDYPTSPPMISLQTTGNHKVRFNPNLYNDGKVCLSVLNTWHGRPEEKWNAQTSSFLQVLVSIQSLILVNEPYFNEPGYERSRGTPSGTANCREYDSNIRQATVKYAMLEMLKHPPPCFKEIIEKHFWLKRKEIKEQIDLWLTDQELPDETLKAAGTKVKSFQTISHNTMLLRKHYQQLMTELQKMKPPEGLSESLDPFTDAMETDVTPSTSTMSPEANVQSPQATTTNTSSASNLVSTQNTMDTGNAAAAAGVTNQLNDISTAISSLAADVASTVPDPATSMSMLSSAISTLNSLENMAMGDDDWPQIQDISSNSSDMMETEDSILNSPPYEDIVYSPTSPYFDDDDDNSNSPGIFL